jgi:protein-S-isoprenylcysteine O-methyltransferase Ste14
MMALTKPQSASDFPTNVLAFVVGLVLLMRLEAGNRSALLFNSMAACVVTALIVAVSDAGRFKVHRRASTELRWDRPRGASATRVAAKLLGLVVTLAVLAAAYWVFPEYHGSFYAPFWTLLETCGPWILLASPFYFWWLDQVEVDPHDSYWEVGLLLTGRRPGHWSTIAQHFGGWVVKGFFLPLMVVFLTQELGATVEWLGRFQQGGLAWYNFFYHFSYLTDLSFCVIGYCATLRVLDSHIRSTEPTAGGWVVALLCYQPFYSVISAQYLHYDDGYYWSAWLGGHPWLRGCWAAVILVLLAIYSLCTVSFGLRFSNLTNRGIITGGPYRFTKHPSYLSKNLSWWMISIPFVGQMGWPRALRNCAALALLNTIYFLRARTEERHLSRDPSYVAYATWIEQRGLFRFVNRIVPALSYRAPAVRPPGAD